MRLISGLLAARKSADCSMGRSLPAQKGHFGHNSPLRIVDPFLGWATVDLLKNGHGFAAFALDDSNAIVLEAYIVAQIFVRSFTAPGVEAWFGFFGLDNT